MDVANILINRMRRLERRINNLNTEEKEYIWRSYDGSDIIRRNTTITISGNVFYV